MKATLIVFALLIIVSGCDNNDKTGAPEKSVENVQTSDYGTTIYSPEQFTPEARYTRSMKKLNSASTKLMRFYALTDLSITSFEAGKTDDAREYATELLKLASLYKSNWNYGNAIHKGNIVLGRIAIVNNELATAKNYLLKAGNTPGSPQLNSFGPNMTLAKDLLEKSESEVVIEYIKKCKMFWEMEGDRVEFWVYQINKGKTPDFGANTLY